MARGVNKVILVGNLGADPETRSMPSGMTVTNIRIATSESWKDKASGAQQERTEWHSIALFGRLGEIAAEYLRKGSQVFIEGKLRTRKWQDKQGNDRFTTEIVADNMQMLGGRGRRRWAAASAAPRAPPARHRVMTMTRPRLLRAAKRILTTIFRSRILFGPSSTKAPESLFFWGFFMSTVLCGRYAFSENDVMTITREGDHLFLRGTRTTQA